jgi:hypothetical protein
MPGMGDEYTVGDEDGLSPTLVDVRDAVCRELYAQLPLRNQRIGWDDIAGVAYAITVSLDRQRLLADTTAQSRYGHAPPARRVDGR